MEKRYQVFVSSTFEDLQAERQEIMQALLELDCIPAGMELFPAADEDQWTLIKDVINDCDYYILILAGRYGSVNADGISYTELEYRYALEQGKPILSFLHRDPSQLPAHRCETDASQRARLEEFRCLVRQKMCRFWTTAPELGGIVSRSMVRLIKHHPAVGWVKADQLPTSDPAGEILRLQREIDRLKREEIESVPGSSRAGLKKAIDRQANYGTEEDWIYLLDSAIERVDIMGRTLFNWTQSTGAVEVIAEKIKRDSVTFRWLVMSNENPFLPLLQEKRLSIGTDLREQLKVVSQFIADIKARLPEASQERMQIRFFRSVPLYFSYLRIDGRFFIAHYLYSAGSSSSPMLYLEDIKTDWPKAYAREFEVIWNLPTTTQNDA